MKICSKCQIAQPDTHYHKDLSKSSGLCPVCKVCKKKQVKEYYSHNRDLCNEKKKIRHQHNKAEINFKRRKYSDVEGRGVYNKTNPQHFDFGASLRKPSGVSSYNRLVRQYKKTASARNLEFALSDDVFRNLVTGNCHYCGLIPNQTMKSKDCNGEFVYNGIDRVDNKQGYVASNCVSCCKICNRAKNNLSEKEWRDWVSRLVAFHTSIPHQPMD